MAEDSDEVDQNLRRGIASPMQPAMKRVERRNEPHPFKMMVTRGVAAETPAGVPRDEKMAMERSVATAMMPRRMPASCDGGRERSWGEGVVDEWV